jgi:hypothetical protein
MPSYTINRYRLWCKLCNNFTLHERIYKDEFKHDRFELCYFPQEKTFTSLCDCNSNYSTVSIMDIPNEKVIQQRKRFKEQRSEYFRDMMNIYGSLSSSTGLFSPPEIGYKVIESDAGLEHEEKLERESKAKIKEEQNLELTRYKNVGRNDTCLCGSNIKYKKCCLIKHLKY